MTLPITLETRTRLRADSSSDDGFSTGGIGFLLLQHAPRTRQHQLSPAHRTIASIEMLPSGNEVFLRLRSHHHQHVTADRRRLQFLRRTMTVLGMLQAA